MDKEARPTLKDQDSDTNNSGPETVFPSQLKMRKDFSIVD